MYCLRYCVNSSNRQECNWQRQRQDFLVCVAVSVMLVCTVCGVVAHTRTRQIMPRRVRALCFVCVCMCVCVQGVQVKEKLRIGKGKGEGEGEEERE